MEKIKYVVRLFTIVLFLGTIAINRDHKILAKNITELTSSATGNVVYPTEWIDEEGNLMVSSVNLAQDILGFAAPVPVVIHIRNNIITKIEVLKNSETPDFFNAVLNAGLLQRWNGMTPQEAIGVQPDVVSGATMSSSALIQTVQRTLEYIVSVEPQSKDVQIDYKVIIGLIVIILGIILSLFKLKSKKWRTMQLVLNVVVLGFWCGSFLSLSLFVNWIANGVNLIFAGLTICLLLVAIIMPLIGRKNIYCTWHCPLGSLQELSGKIVKYKLVISQRNVKRLTKLREGIFMALLFVMWIGLGFDLINYELFSFFLFNQASEIIIVLGFIFIGLSFVIQRPYCRFVCPTGTILKFLER